MQQVIVQGGRQHGKNAARMEWVRRDAPDLYDLISQLAPEDQYQATLFAGEDQPVSLLFTKLNWRLTIHRQGRWGWVAEVHDLNECEKHPEVFISPMSHIEGTDRWAVVSTALREARKA